MKPDGVLKSSQNRRRPRYAIRKSPVPRWWTEVSLRTIRRPTPSMAACTCKDNLGSTTAQGNFLVSLSSYMPEYPDDFLFSYLITARSEERRVGKECRCRSSA